MSYLDIVVDHEVLMLGHERLPPGRGLALDTAHGDGDPVTAPDRLRATDPLQTPVVCPTRHRRPTLRPRNNQKYLII